VRDGIDAVRGAIADALDDEGGPAGIGLEVVAVRVTAVRPASEVEQALQTPLREAIQQEADEATFARRARAVDKERAIAENELGNRIELARREQDLIAQQGMNDRRRGEEAAVTARIEAEAQAQRDRLSAASRAAGIREVGEAQAAAEDARIGVYRDLPVPVLLGLAARELAGKLERIDHVNLAPDSVGPLLSTLLAAGTRRLEAEDR
jgi:predicted pyridoxine 5'-phosphate oxidase superfamily flavin-nucleotide-binding protein